MFVLDKILNIFEVGDVTEIAKIVKTINQKELSPLLLSKHAVVEYITSRNKYIKTNFDVNWKVPDGAVLNRCSSIYMYRKYGKQFLFVSICDSNPPISFQIL